MLAAALQARWYADAPAPLLLRPLAALYARIATRRRARLRCR
jgi:tetraacyldisaccharide-1-P 4'-kinase